MTNKTPLALILIFATLVIAGSLFVFFEKQGAVNAPFNVGQRPPVEPVSPLAPKGWKTYTNKEFGFALAYPGDWEINKKLQPEPNTTGLIPLGDNHFFLISIRTHLNPLNLEIEKYFNSRNIERGGFNGDPRAIEYDFSNKLRSSTLIINNPSYLYENEFYKINIIAYKNRIYEIRLLKGFNSEKIFDKILSTFRFVE